MFESIAEQITDDFLYLVSIEYRIIRVGWSCILKNNLLLSEDGNKQFEDAASISHNISFDIFDACMVGFYRAKFQKLIDQELKPLDIPIDDFHFFPGNCIVSSDWYIFEYSHKDR